MTLLATFPVPNQRMSSLIGDTEVAAVWIGAGVPPGLDLFLAPAWTLVLLPGLHLSLDWLYGELEALLTGRTIGRGFGGATFGASVSSCLSSSTALAILDSATITGS